MEDLVKVLKILGLTEYEAKAYLSLIKIGVADAKTVSEISGVPRTRIYDVIHSLERRNLVQATSSSRPTKYSPLPIEATLDELKKGLLEELNRGVEAIGKLYRESLAGEEFNAWVIRGEPKTYQAALKIAEEASKIVVFHCSSIPNEIFSQMVKALKSVKSRGVQVFAVIDSGFRNLIKPKAFKVFIGEFNPRIASFFLPLNLVLADFKEMIIFYAPTSGQIESPEPVGLYVKTGGLRKLLEEKFVKLLKSSKRKPIPQQV